MITSTSLSLQISLDDDDDEGDEGKNKIDPKKLRYAIHPFIHPSIHRWYDEQIETKRWSYQIRMQILSSSPLIETRRQR